MLAFLTSLDIFGHSVGVTFKGDGSLKTRFGAFITLSTFALMIVNLVNLCVQFVDKSAQKEGQNTIQVDTLDMEWQNLNEQNFFLAFS